ncbi:MAG: sigma-70 family RNA polymerase sigma factor [Flavobacteriales bacterium]|nr:sigma-70 family RNA polymerase sigma factor [Flavobacteriales bacterium]
MLLGKEADRDKALKTIYGLCRDQIHRYILVNSGDESDASDMQQEAMIVFYENVRDNRFKGESAISTYVFSIAKFKWLNELKRNRKASERHLKVVSEEKELDPSQQIMKKEEQEMILDLISGLDENCKDLLVQSFYFDASMKEIVQKLGFSNEQVARNKKYKCLKSLRKLLRSDREAISILKSYEF